jgi:hypothetical protein
MLHLFQWNLNRIDSIQARIGFEVLETVIYFYVGFWLCNICFRNWFSQMISQYLAFTVVNNNVVIFQKWIYLNVCSILYENWFCWKAFRRSCGKRMKGHQNCIFFDFPLISSFWCFAKLWVYSSSHINIDINLHFLKSIDQSLHLDWK